MSSKLYGILELPNEESQTVLDTLRTKPGVSASDVPGTKPPDILLTIEARDRMTAMDYLICCLDLVDNLIENVHMLTVYE
jgi:hypothetical protein